MIENYELAEEMAYAEAPYMDMYASNVLGKETERATLLTLANHAGIRALNAYVTKLQEQVSANSHDDAPENDNNLDENDEDLKLASDVIINREDIFEFALTPNVPGKEHQNRVTAGQVWSYLQRADQLNPRVNVGLIFKDKKSVEDPYRSYKNSIDLEFDTLIRFWRKYEAYQSDHPHLKTTEILGRSVNIVMVNFISSFIEQKLDQLRAESNPNAG